MEENYFAEYSYCAAIYYPGQPEVFTVGCTLESSDNDSVVCYDQCDKWIHLNCDASISEEDYITIFYLIVLSMNGSIHVFFPQVSNPCTKNVGSDWSHNSLVETGFGPKKFKVGINR